ncbi:hypothetical protein [Pseudomonas putida]|uniref:Uncharacterized protein n=1 Tax=Pseudomonas putida TaxID=303 RepID=A0A8I1JIZ8_PSEPU|nr:hypothetical protein [Pseudomonas putida]MBI6883089.1 hypothetical protein [Pseudomonas putida]
MLIQNPHAPGSLYHQNFDSLVAYWKNQSSECMKSKHAVHIAGSKNFLSNSCSVMATHEFEADAISRVHEAKYGTSL